MNKIKTILILLIFILTTVSVMAKDIKGNVVSIDLKGKKITISSGSTTEAYQVTSASKLYRSLIDTQPLDVDLLSISPGDAITCSVNDNNVITKATASFNIIRGTIAKIDGNKITTAEGQNIVIASAASISLLNGSMGKVSDLVPGHTFVARTNPNTNEIWTFVISGKVAAPKVPTTQPAKDTKKDTKQDTKQVTKQETKKETKKDTKTEVKTTTPAKPVAQTTPAPKVESVNTVATEDLHIDTVEISAPKTFVSGDLLLVKVTGTAHCGVSADIQYISGTKVKLTEDTPGVYTGFIPVPTKNLNYAKFVAYMSLNNKNISKISDTVLHVKDKTGKLQTVVHKEVVKTAAVEPAPVENIDVPKENEENISTTEATTKPEETTETQEEKVVEKKEAEQITDTKEITDQNTNKESITDPLKASATIKIDDIKIVAPQNDALVQNIQISGLAIPNSTLKVKTIYTNGKNGVLGISGVLHEETIPVNEEGVFNYGPIELNGFFATSGLIYYVEFQYSEDNGIAPKIIRLIRE